MAKEKEMTPEEIKALKDENKKLAAELDAANEALIKNSKLVEELTEQLPNLEVLNAEIEKLKADIETRDKFIVELNEQLNQQEKANEQLGKYPVFTHKGKKYELVDAKSNARYEGKNVVITKETLGEDTKLLEFCIKKGFACLKEKGGK